MNKIAKIALATGAVAAVGYTLYRLARSDKDQETAADAEEETGSKAPLPEPEGKNLKVRINRSTRTKNNVNESPEQLLEQARRYDPGITLDELTGARLAASEYYGGTFTEITCIVDAEVNRAERKGLTLFQSLTHKRKFGDQNGPRPASTRLDPNIRHLLAARAVLSGEARGISQGATKFFDPCQMEKSHRKYERWVKGGRKGPEVKIVSCDAIGVLEAWCFDYRKKGPTRCPPDRSRRGKDTCAWVGHIEGVNASKLMLMEPMRPGLTHSLRFHAAKKYLHQALHGC